MGCDCRCKNIIILVVILDLLLNNYYLLISLLLLLLLLLFMLCSFFVVVGRNSLSLMYSKSPKKLHRITKVHVVPTETKGQQCRCGAIFFKKKGGRPPPGAQQVIAKTPQIMLALLFATLLGIAAAQVSTLGRTNVCFGTHTWFDHVFSFFLFIFEIQVGYTPKVPLTSCQSGFYLVGGYCYACWAGTYAASTTATTCTQCTQGYFWYAVSIC
jgi:hypothetical protein